MRAKEILTGREWAKLEATAFVRDRNRGRRPDCGNDGVRNRLTVVVLYDARDGARRRRSTYDRCGGWLGLRRSEQWCAESDQTADCRRRHKSGCPCHIELRGVRTPIPCLRTRDREVHVASERLIGDLVRHLDFEPVIAFRERRQRDRLSALQLVA